MLTPVATLHPHEAAAVARIIDGWQQRMDPQVFARVCKGKRLLKEVQEALVVVHVVKEHVAALAPDDGAVTVVDLCSGFGYLSMLLAELLPPHRLHQVLLVDR